MLGNVGYFLYGHDLKATTRHPSKLTGFLPCQPLMYFVPTLNLADIYYIYQPLISQICLISTLNLPSASPQSTFSLGFMGVLILGVARIPCSALGELKVEIEPYQGLLLLQSFTSNNADPAQVFYKPVTSYSFLCCILLFRLVLSCLVLAA